MHEIFVWLTTLHVGRLERDRSELVNRAALMASSNKVQILPERVANVSSSAYPHQVPGVSNAWDTKSFVSNLRVDLTRLTNEEADFDIVGVDASIANALRRVLIAEVSSV